MLVFLGKSCQIFVGFRETRGAMSSSRQMSSKRIARSWCRGQKKHQLFSFEVPKKKQTNLPLIWGIDGHPQTSTLVFRWPWPLHPPLLTSELQTSNNGLIDTSRKGESGEVGGRTIHGFLNKKTGEPVEMHPGRLTWNIITHLERNMIFPTECSMLILQGVCITKPSGIHAPRL